MILKRELSHRMSLAGSAVVLLSSLLVLPIAAQNVEASAADPESALGESAAKTSSGRLPNSDELREVGKRAAQGDPGQLDKLDSLRKQLYAGVDLAHDIPRARANLEVMMAGFTPIGNAAASGNDRAMFVLRAAMMHDRLRGFAVVTLGNIAAEGNSEALEILLHHERYNIVKSSAVGALATAAKTGDDRVVAFLTKVVESEQERPLWWMAANGLKAAAAQGNENAARALAKMKPLRRRVR